MWQRGMVAAAVATLAVGAAACGGGSGAASSATAAAGGAASSAASSGSGPTIALLLPETKTTRYEQQDRPTFEARVKQLCPNCKIFYANANQDSTKQQQQADAAITQGAKVIAISAVDVASAGSIVAKANARKVPVIAYGRLIPDADIAYYVSIDPYKVGQQQGTALIDALNKKGISKPRIVMINGAPTDSNAAPYKKGAHSIIDGKATVVKEYDTPDWSPDKAQNEMQQAITAVGKNGFDGVYAANDGTAGGAIAAMKSAQIDPSTKPVTGQDAEVAAIQRILAGQQLMTVYQPILKIANSAAELAVALATGKPVPNIATGKVNNGKKDVPSVLLDTVSITKDNVQDTVIKEGFVKVADVCTGAYAAACAAAGIK